MSYLLVGESPNRATVRRPDLWLVPDDSGARHTANRLRDLAGWTNKEYLRVFSRRDNVLPLPPKDGRWRKAHDVVAQDRAWKMLRDHHLADGIVCLGMRAYVAFSDVTGCGIPSAQDVVPCTFYREGDGTRARVAYLPHTSGLNRWWNDAANRILGTYFLRGLLPKVPT